MRKREIREYTLYGGVRTGLSSHLRAIGLSLLVVASVIGLCGLTTIVTRQTDRLEASRLTHDDQAATKTTAITTTALTTQEARTLQSIPVAKTKKVSSNIPNKPISKKAVEICNQTARASAMNKQSMQLRQEASRHRHVVRSLQATGLLTKFFNPYLYSNRVKQENTHHKDVMKQVQQTYIDTLKQAHC